MTQETLARHILPSSATMVGVCLTSISLVKLLEERIGASKIDEYLALNSIVFLISAVSSYLSLRPRHNKALTQRLERLADVLFIVGLCAMVLIAVLFAYEGI